MALYGTAIDLEVRQGERLGLIGPNGSGKVPRQLHLRYSAECSRRSFISTACRGYAIVLGKIAFEGHSAHKPNNNDFNSPVYWGS